MCFLVYQATKLHKLYKILIIAMLPINTVQQILNKIVFVCLAAAALVFGL
jgi:hypothetical protein